ncbi:MAG: hypothetical protein ACYDDS_14485 [Candidatus Sulfotelmatobacter sp.]|jgi:hypothetical protein
MKLQSAGICLLALLFFISLVQSVQAQTQPLAPPAGPFSYDATHEVTLNGTVSGVLAKQTPEMAPGSHLLLTTLSGPVDISLGTFALRGAGALSVTSGQQVAVVGVMKIFKEKPVFLARAVKVGDHVYEIRNEHGIPITPQARERVNQHAAQNWETR